MATASKATRTVPSIETHECPMCDGGTVDLFISGVYAETIQCPDCKGSGKVSATGHHIMMDGINALEKAFADEQYKY